MSDFMNYVIHYLFQALVRTIPVVILFVVGLRYAVKRYRQKHGDEKPFPWKKAMLVLMLLGYWTILIYVTVQRSSHYGWHDANLHLFRAWREAWNDFSEKSWLNILLNIGMFVPLGVLLPLMHRRLQKWYVMLPLGFLSTLIIEAAQYFGFRGLFDVDDLFNNTLGAAIGFFTVTAVIHAANRRWLRSIGHVLPVLAAIGAIGSVFLVYENQTYGNLPEAPAFQVDTSNVEWTVSCDIGEEGETVPIYRLESPDRETCEIFGREFMAAQGVQQVDVFYYNEEVYLREHQDNRLMEVFYLDRSFYYWDARTETGPEEVEPTQTDEATIRAALADFGIDVPDAAEFYINANMEHCFVLERQITGNTMIDGKIKCGYYEDGIHSIDHKMLTYDFWGEAEILSPAAALERLQEGWLTGGDWFEHKKPPKVEVLSCTLSWQVDTKGFSQPVYLFEVVSEDTNYQMTEMIPALK